MPSLFDISITSLSHDENSEREIPREGSGKPSATSLENINIIIITSYT